MPEICRWVSLDKIRYLNPFSVNGLNLYIYCNNNPINFSDNSGNYPYSIHKKITPDIYFVKENTPIENSPYSNHVQGGYSVDSIPVFSQGIFSSKPILKPSVNLDEETKWCPKVYVDLENAAENNNITEKESIMSRVRNYMEDGPDLYFGGNIKSYFEQDFFKYDDEINPWE